MQQVETLITLSKEVTEEMNKWASQYQDHSTFIEEALWAFMKKQQGTKSAKGDLDIINQHADALNEEAADVLEYQVSLLKSTLTNYVGRLLPAKMQELDKALGIALDKALGIALGLMI